MLELARDEARHAELAWDVAAFCNDRLVARDRATTRDAMRAAALRLRGEIERPLAEDVVRVAGMPTPVEARLLLGHLERFIDAASTHPRSTSTHTS